MNEEKNADPQQQRTHQHIPASFVIRVENPPRLPMFRTARIGIAPNRTIPFAADGVNRRPARR
jgi:hypothetical protein